MNSSAYPTVKPANLYKTTRAGKTVNPIFNMDQIASGTSAGTDVSQPAATKQNTKAVPSAPKAPLHGQGAPRKAIHHLTEKHARKTIHHQGEFKARKTVHSITETAKRKVILGRLETAKRKVVSPMTRPMAPNTSMAKPSAHNGARIRTPPKNGKSTKALFG